MTPEPDAGLRRLQRIAVGFGGALALALTLWRGPVWGLGGALGVGLSLVNFSWLKAGGWRFALRYAVLALVLCGIFVSHLVPFGAVLFGLFAIPAAALAEACLQLFSARF